jgi:3-hydroxybutyryl-CoA dehydrogenase
MNMKNQIIGIVGAGAMGSGIAQVAAMAGHKVVLFDNNPGSLEKAQTSLHTNIHKLQEKGKISNAAEIFQSISFTSKIEDFAPCKLIIEAIIEQLGLKNRCRTIVRWLPTLLHFR